MGRLLGYHCLSLGEGEKLNILLFRGEGETKYLFFDGGGGGWQAPAFLADCGVIYRLSMLLESHVTALKLQY